MRPLQLSRQSSRVRTKRRQLRLELLEERRVLAAVVWDGEAGDGLWSTAANWSNNAVPGSGDNVEIQASPSGQVILRGTVPSIGSLVNRGSLFLEGGVADGAAVLNVLGNSFNFGNVRLEATSTDSANRSTRLNVQNNAVFTNAASGIIEARAGTGGSRTISGNLLNEGTVSSVDVRLIMTGNTTQAAGQLMTGATGEVVQQGGNFVLTGGIASGTVRLNGTTINVAASATQSTTLRVVGDNNYFQTNFSPQTTLWLEGTTTYGFSRLYYSQNVTNLGTIHMESTSSDANNQDSYLDGQNNALFTNASSGMIRVAVGTGDSRYLRGNFVNTGSIVATSGSRLNIINGNAVQAGGVWQTIDTGEILRTGGTFTQSGGSVQGRVRFTNSTIDVASSVNQASTLRLVGSNFLNSHLSTASTLWLEGSTNYGSSTLFVDQDATNAGTIRMESSSSDANDQSSYLVMRSGARLTSTATGSISALAGAGDARRIQGRLVNSGSLTAGAGTELLHLTGAIQFNGGTVGGQVRFRAVNVSVGSSATTPATLRIVGDNNVLQSHQSPNVTLWLEGNTDYGLSRMYVDNIVTSAGAIRLESSSDNTNDQSSYLQVRNDGVLTIASTGIIDVLGGAGDQRYLQGTIINHGTIRTRTGVRTTVGADLTTDGSIVTDDGGEFLQNSGSFNMTGGALTGLVRVNHTQINVTAGVTTSSTLRIVGGLNSLLNNHSPNVTLWLEGTTTYGYSQLLYNNNAVSQGNIRLEATSNNGGDQASYLDGPTGAILTIGPTAILDVRAGAGDARYVSGNVINEGTFSFVYPTNYSGNLVNRGIISVAGGSSVFSNGSLINDPNSYLGLRTSFSLPPATTNNGTIDTTTGAILSDVQVYPSAVMVGFSAAGGMLAQSVTNLANYTLLRSGGDGIFGNGNDEDVSARLASSSFDASSQLLGIAISGGLLPNDTYLLTIAASNLTNSNNEPLFGAAIPIKRSLNYTSLSQNVDLVTSSDSGQSNADNITNDNTPTFSLVASGAGTFDIDFNGDAQTDQSFPVTTPGVYEVTAGTLPDAALSFRAIFTPIAGAATTSQLSYTIDTVAPLITNAIPSVTMPSSSRRIKFSETLDTTNLSATIASMTMVGPSNATIAINSVQLISSDTLEVTYPALTIPGAYSITISLPLPDVAGNYPGGALTDAFQVMPDLVPPRVQSVTPFGLVNTPIQGWQIEFTEAISPSSFTSDDVTILTPVGQLPANSITVTVSPANNRLFTIVVPTQSIDGNYTLTLARDIRDLANNQMLAPYSANTILDTLGPRVQSVSVIGTINAPLDHIDVVFSERLSSFAAADVQLTTPTGVVPVGTPEWLGGFNYRIPLATQRSNGNYTLRIGPGVRDAAGNNMDVGSAGGVYITNFAVSLSDLTIANNTLNIVPSPSTFGTPLTINWRLHNAGTFGTPPTWTDRIWLSSDNQLGGDDRLLTSINQSITGGIASGNSQDFTATVTAPLDAGLAAGNYFVFVQTDAVDAVTESVESNNTQATPLSLSYPPLPDLIIVANSIVGPVSSDSGATFNVQWSVDNIGTATAVGPWIEKVYLATSLTSNDRQLIGQFSQAGNLTVNAPVLNRSVTLTLPDQGIGGTWVYIVEIDAARQVFEGDENNTFVSVQTLDVPLRFSIELSHAEITEAGSPIEVSLTRNGSIAQPLTVSLSLDVASQLNVPAQVTIPAGQYTTKFNMTAIDDAAIEPLRGVTLTAAAASYPDITSEFFLLDNDLASLTLTLTPATANESHTIAGRVTRSQVTDQEQELTLLADPAQVTSPLTVTIPANQAFIDFSITVNEDTLVEATTTYPIVATAAGLLSSTSTLSVAENDVPILSMVLPATSLAEGSHGPTIQGVVSRATATDRAQEVSLQSSDSTLLTVPGNITIPAGATTATFAFAVNDDALVNGNRNITLTARPVSSDGVTTFVAGGSTATLTVLDNDGPSLSLAVAPTIIAESGLATLTIRRNTSTATPLTVSLNSNLPGQLQVPNTAVIPIGSETVDVTIQGINDRVVDGDQQVVLTVQADGYNSSVAALVVTDTDLPDLYVPSIGMPATAETGQMVDVSVLLSNIGLSSAMGTIKQRSFFSTDAQAGDDTLAGQFDYTGPLLVGQTYSRPLSVRMPAAPGQYWLVVQTDVEDAVREGLENNNTTVSALPINVVPSFTATVSTNVESAPADVPVPLTGFAQKTDGSPAPFEQVAIQVSVLGTKRTITTFTDAAGNFSASFKPLAGEGGLYTIGAAHPGVTEAPIQDSFRLVGMRATLGATAISIIEGTITTAEIDVTNLADIDQTGMQIELVDAPANLSVSMGIIGNSTSLTPRGTLSIYYEVAATNSTIIHGQIKLRISTDQSRAGNAADLFITLDTTVIPLQVQLELDRPVITSSMVIGGQTTVEFTVANKGGRDSGPLTLELPSGVAWLKAVGGNTLPSIAAGQSTTVSMLLQPPADLPLSLYNGAMVLRATDSALELPFSIRAVESTIGDLQISIVDELFYFTEAKPLVTTSVVVLRDPYTRDEILRSNPSGTGGGSGEGDDRPGVSVDSQGRVNFINLPAGPYELEVISDNHDPHVENIEVSPGSLIAEQVFVSRNFVKYNWTVEQVEVEDRTRVTIESVFETNVPAPVITIDGMVKLDEVTVVGQTKQFDIKITNHGLIAAQDIALRFGNYPNFRITPLVDTIGTLLAKTEVIVPVMVTRIADTGGALTAEGEGEECGPTSVVIYNYICEDRVWKAIPIGVQQVAGFCRTPVIGFHFTDQDGPTGVVARILPITITESKGCNCKQFEIFSVDFSKYLKAPVELVKTVINGYLTPLRLKTELSAKASASLTTCCEATPLGVGLKFSAQASLSAKISDSHNFGIDPVVKKFEASDGSEITVSGSLFVGVEAFVRASVSGSVQSLCDYSDVVKSLSGSITVGIRAGVSGDLKFTKSSGAGAGEIVKTVNATLNGETSISFSYSNEKGLQYCLNSEALFIDLSWDLFGKKYSPFDNLNTPDVVETRYDLLPAYKVCSTPDQNRLFSDESDAFTKSLQERMGIYKSSSRIEVATYNQPAAGEGANSCAQVRLQITQDAVLTRTAFRASMELDNLGVTSPVQNLSIDINVFDSNGVLVDDLFTVLTPELKSIDKLDGTGLLAANTKGSATWMIFANREAAPSTAVTYAVGGSMRYTQNGERITIPLTQVPITVLPDAELHLDYFLQRDVLADDPFTDVIEPSQPFSLAVMVKNEGAGIAKALRLESAQPRIKENEKGLLIDFEIIASAVNGQPAERSLVARLGNVGPGQLAFAEWQMLSTLEGLFVEYDARFEHVSGLGDNRLSLIKRVNIHELIRVVDDKQTGRIDVLPDFLVNDVPDGNDLPETLYLSDGTKADVSLGSNATFDAPPQLGDLQVTVTATMPAGWSYLKMDDPSAGNLKLVGVRRSDGTSLPLKNFWQTDRTFIGNSQRPVLEDKIHLLDLNSTGTYTFLYSNGDVTPPGITTLGATVPNPAQTPISTVDITYSEPIDLATFDWTDLVLRKNGSPLTLNASVTINQVSGAVYAINGLSTFTGDDGVYELSVVGTGVQDLVGNSGSSSATVTWAKGQSAPAIVNILGVPRDATNQAPSYVDIAFTEPIDLGTLSGQDIQLERNGTLLSLASATFNSVTDRIVRVDNIAALLANDGDYRFTVNAAGIVDLDAGLSGIGSRTATWSLDRTAPSLLDVVDIVTDPRNTAVQRIDVEFSELIDLSTFDGSDLVLTRDNGTTNLIAGDSRVSIERLFDRTYRISGINWVQGFLASPLVAQFTLTVTGAGIRDRAGNAAIGSASESWTIDLDKPQALANVVLRSQGVPVVDGILPSVLAEISGTTAEAGLTIAVRDMTSDTELAREKLNGQSFTLPIRFPSPGNHQLRVRLTDAAGNTKDLLISDLFVLDTPPVIESVTGLPVVNSQLPVNSLTVNFVSNIDMNSFQLSDMRLTRNGGANLLNGSVTVTPQSNGRSLVIGNLAGLNNLDGLYEFQLILSGVASTTGLPGSGIFSQTWKLDRVAPTSSVSALLPTQALPTFSVRVSGHDPQLASNVTGSGISHYELQVSSNGGPFTLWRTLPADQPSADYAGRPNFTYSFRSVAIDAAGNVGSASAPVSTTVPDLFAPVTQVVSLNSSQSRVTVNVSGTDAGNDLRFFDVYVSVDGADPIAVARVPAGTPNAQGLYSASLFYKALTDGLPHNYRIFCRGVDGSQNMEEAAGETKGLKFSATYVAYPTLIGEPIFGDGGAQRSIVDRIVMTFDGPVQLQSGAVVLTKRSTGQAVTLTPASSTNSQGQYVLTFSFSGPDTRAGGLADGYYQLAIDGTKIVSNGRGLDIDGDGVGGDSRTVGTAEADNYFALYGDTNGDGLVGVSEFGQLRSAFGKSTGQPGFDVNFDYDRDGNVGVADFGQFRSRFGKPKLPF